MKTKVKKPAWLVTHERSDQRRFNELYEHQKEILGIITTAVENAVDTKINGKLKGIKEQLEQQDLAMIPVVTAFKEDKIIKAEWSSGAKKLILYTSAGIGSITFIGLVWSFIKNLHP